MTSGDEDARPGRETGDEPETEAGSTEPGSASGPDDDQDLAAGADGAGGADPADADIEGALRGMLARRAERIQPGATWHPPNADAGGEGQPRRQGLRHAALRRPGRIPARRWLLPAAAAAVVVALVVTVITVRDSGSPVTVAGPGPTSATTEAGTTSQSGGPVNNPPWTLPASLTLAPAPAPVAQRPIPAGLQAVDALGVEIFVPKSLTLDPPCSGDSVSRPAYGLTYGINCIAPHPPTVSIMTATNAADGLAPTTGPCVSTVELDGEKGCVRFQNVTDSPTPATAAVIWPQHDVSIIAGYPAGQRKKALAVIESAHWVPVDRHGCAATRSPVVPAGAASLPEGSVLPADATSTSVCWYSGGRLVASATLPRAGGSGDSGNSGSSGSADDSGGIAQSLEHPGVPGNAPGIGTAPSYSPSPDGPACSTLGRTEGIVFQSTRPDGSIAVSAAQFADCTGGQYWTDGTHAQPVDEALASAIRGLTGFLLVFGYRAQPLDPVTSSATSAPLSELPATTGPNDSSVASTPVTDNSVMDGSGLGNSVTDSTVTSNSVTDGTVTSSPVTSSSVTDSSVTDNTTTVAPAQRPIPAGMQAVDALGVEIFVPKGLPLDPVTCTTETSAIFRPVPQLPHGADCPGLSRRTVQIGATDRDARPDPAAPCQAAPVLNGEAGCLSVAVAAAQVDRPLWVSAAWPAHQVAIQIMGAQDDQQWALNIVRSAHWVPVDRNGCAATRSTMAVTGSDAATPILPTAASSLSVCWYLGNRLGASALLNSAATSRVIAAVNAAPPRWPAPQDRPSLTPCATVAQHDGVLLAAHLPNGSTAQALGTFAACNGQQTISNGAGAVLATKHLVSTIADAAGLGSALVLDYPYTPS